MHTRQTVAISPDTDWVANTFDGDKTVVLTPLNLSISNAMIARLNVLAPNFGNDFKSLVDTVVAVNNKLAALQKTLELNKIPRV